MSIQLTTEQRMLLVNIRKAATPQIAYTETHNGSYASNAADILHNHGYIYMTPDTAEVTEKGEQKMVDDNLIDAGGQITDHGNSLLTNAGDSDTLPPPEPQATSESYRLMKEASFRAK